MYSIAVGLSTKTNQAVLSAARLGGDRAAFYRLTKYQFTALSSIHPPLHTFNLYCSMKRLPVAIISSVFFFYSSSCSDFARVDVLGLTCNDSKTFILLILKNPACVTKEQKHAKKGLAFGDFIIRKRRGLFENLFYEFLTFLISHDYFVTQSTALDRNISDSELKYKMQCTPRQEKFSGLLQSLDFESSTNCIRALHIIGNSI